MIKPAYEIVEAGELKVGDIVTIEPDLDPWVMDEVRLSDSHLFYRGGGQTTGFSMPRDRRIFRQLPPVRNPDVLEKAMLCMEIAWRNGANYGRTGIYYIDMAIRELESDGAE